MRARHSVSSPDSGWLRSSRSNPSQNCVEVRFAGVAAGIRDSKNALGPTLHCTTAGLSRFVEFARLARP